MAISAATSISGNKLPVSMFENLARRRIPKLDALRAISALVVVLYHGGFSFFPAGLGVLVFFVISGFLITWLLLEEFDKTKNISLVRFYFRRTFRIFPAFYVYLGVVIAGLLIRRGNILWGQVVSTFFYVGNYYQGLNGYPETGLSHAWSLGVEEQFYLLWPAVFMKLAHDPKRLLRFTCAAIVAVWICRLSLYYFGVPEYYLYTAFETRVDHILVGCVLAISVRHHFFANVLSRVCARSGLMIISVAGLLLSNTAAWYIGTGYRDTIGHIVDPLLIVAAMAQLLATSSKRLAWLDSVPLVFLGSISYSTYLYHKLAFLLVSRASEGLAASTGLVIVVSIVVTYVLASASYFTVEKPFLRLRDRIESRYRLTGRALQH